MGEIESALARHPSIRDCVVLARDDMAELTRLVAYIVPEASKPKPWPSPAADRNYNDLPRDAMAHDRGRGRPYLNAGNSTANVNTALEIGTGPNGNGQSRVPANGSGLVPTLRRFLQEQLPEYMVPSAFVVLE